MEFPDDAITNVFRLDDVSQVDWTVYSIFDSSNRRAGRPQVGEHSSHEPLSTQKGLLEEAVNALRTGGFHSLLDLAGLAIWTFEIRNGSVLKDHEASMQKKISNVVDSYSLIKKAGGTIWSSGSPKVSQSSAPSASEASMKSNADEFDANTRIKTENLSPGQVVDGPQNDDDLIAIRSKFLASISFSMLSTICTDSGWMAIGSSCCIGPYQDSDIEIDPFGLGPSVHDVFLLSTSLRWYPSGTLMITGLRTPAKDLRRLSESGVNLESDSEPAGLQVIVIPSGIKAEFVSHITNKHRNMKRLITDHLRLQNIKIPPSSEWVKLRVVVEGTADRALALIWPSSLCIVKSGGAFENHPHALSARYDDVSQWKDPLEDAERWFMGKSARDEELDRKRKVQESFAEVSHDFEHSDDEEALGDEEGLPNGRLSLPDMSGVYPTPPDGAPLPPHSMASTHDQSNQYESTANLSNNVTLGFGSSSIAASPTFMETSRYNDNENEDLFGEIDSEMFAANGLTEDDFNFFDEPSPDDVGVTGNEQTILPHYELNKGSVGSRVEDMISDQKHAVTSYAEVANFGDDGDLPTVEQHPSQNLDFGERRVIDPNIVQINTPPISSDTAVVNGPKSQEIKVQESRPDLLPPKKVESEVLDYNESKRGGPETESEQVSFDHKYMESGRFGYENVNTPEGSGPGQVPECEEFAIPTIGTLIHPDSLLSDSDSTSSDEDFALEPDHGETAEETSTASSREEEQLETSFQSSLKRKRERSVCRDNPPSPSDSYTATTSPERPDQNPAWIPDLMPLLQTLLRPYSNPLDILENSGSKSHFPPSLEDPQTYLRVAQLLADQIAQRGGDGGDALYPFSDTMLAQDSRSIKSGGASIDPFESALRRVLPGATHCDLKSVIGYRKGSLPSAQKENTSSQTTTKCSTVPHQLSKTLDAQHRLFEINAPLANVRRMEERIDISISALPFWEELGLAPISTEKDVTAFCVCPQSKFVEERIVSFLEAVRSCYQSCKLGVHRLGFDSIGHNGALISVPTSIDNIEEAIDRMAETCKELGRKLASSRVEGTNFVIYMINPSSIPSDLPLLCAVFLKLFESYASSLKGQKLEKPNDMILHILPLAAVASDEHLVVPAPATYKAVAFEVYSRCAPRMDFDSVSPFSCAPAIQLARTIPRTVNLNLTSTPITGLPHSDRCIHVGYYWNLHAPWLSASWTDNQGCLQWSACYRIAVNAGQSWPTFREAIKEVWDTTMDLIKPKNIPWRVFIAKGSPMGRAETDVWLTLSAQSLHGTFITLLAVDDHPDLEFPPSLPAAPHTAMPVPATPALTPTAPTISPEQSGYPPTPGTVPFVGNLPTPTAVSFDHDTDARLVDITEETWGVVVESPLDDSIVYYPTKEPELCPASLSGYLLKRAGPRDEHGLVTLGVDIVHPQKPSSALLKEVLVMYRCLGTLARIRGVANPTQCLLPWHLAIAQKSYASVRELMPWERD